MKYVVKLIQANVISRNHRVYTDEAIKKIMHQFNTNSFPVYKTLTEYFDDDLLKQKNRIGTTLKNSYIKDDCLYVEMDIKATPPLNNVAISLTGEESLPTSDDQHKYKFMFPEECSDYLYRIAKPAEVKDLFFCSDHAYFKECNFKKKENLIIDNE